MDTPGDSRAGDEPVQVELSVSVAVSDPEALRAYARRQYGVCWFDRDWEPVDLAEAVLEALVLSNENPSPVDYGIEILGFEATEALQGVEAAAAASKSGAGAVRSRGKERRGND
jgi:uncharacterized protein (UPF0371 family)